MPNHIHAIVVISQDDMDRRDRRDARQCVSNNDKLKNTGIAYRRPKSLSSFVAGYKSVVSKRINAILGTIGQSVWQSGFYDCIIRSKNELMKIQNYIKNNPKNWEEDPER
jgi:REP element-mobilizing transposase RayT